MNMVKTITNISCTLLTIVYGKRGCESYDDLIRATLKVLNSAFCKDVDENYLLDANCTLQPWINRFDHKKCSHLSRFIEDKMGVVVTTAEILECETLYQLSIVIDEHTMHLFPSGCSKCSKCKLCFE